MINENHTDYTKLKCFFFSYKIYFHLKSGKDGCCYSQSNTLFIPDCQKFEAQQFVKSIN